MKKVLIILMIFILLMPSVVFADQQVEDPPETEKDCPPSFAGETKFFVFIPDGKNLKCDNGEKKEVKKVNKSPKRKVRIPTDPRSVATEALLLTVFSTPYISDAMDLMLGKMEEMDPEMYDYIFNTTYPEVFHEKILNYSDLFYDTFLPKIEEIYGSEWPDLTKHPDLVQKIRATNLDYRVVHIFPTYYYTDASYYRATARQIIIIYNEKTDGYGWQDFYAYAPTVPPAGGSLYPEFTGSGYRLPSKPYDTYEMIYKNLYDTVFKPGPYNISLHEFYSDFVNAPVPETNIPAEVPLIELPNTTSITITEIDDEPFYEVEYEEFDSNGNKTSKVAVIPFEQDRDTYNPTDPKRIPVYTQMPEPTLDPEPEPTPDPEPEPTPDPEPEPTPDPEPEPGSGTGVEIPTAPEPIFGDGSTCGKLDLDLKSVSLFTNKFPFSIPFDIYRAIDAFFGGMGSEKPEFVLSFISSDTVLTIPDFIDELVPLIRTLILFIFDVSIIYALYRWFGGAS